MVRSAGCAGTVDHSKKRHCAQAALRKETSGGADPLADDLGVLQMPTERLVERVRAGFPFPELELLVQLEADDVLRRHWRYCAVEVALQAILACESWADLPPDHAAWPAPASTRALGERWIAESVSVGLSVSSGVTPGGHNILLNPGHPEYAAAVVVGAPQPLRLDR